MGGFNLGSFGKGQQTLQSVAQYLKGMDWPASKQDIVETAQSHNAPQEVVAVLQRLPDQMYEEMNDIWQALGQKI